MEAGENDLILRNHTEYIAKEIREARLKIYQGAYISIPIEKAEELCVDVMEFFKN